MFYLIQDVTEDPRYYISSHKLEQDALQLVQELEEQDKKDGTYQSGKYKVSKHGICYNRYAHKCGHNTNSFCMLEHPDTDCPLVKKRAAMKAADDGGPEGLCLVCVQAPAGAAGREIYGDVRFPDGDRPDPEQGKPCSRKTYTDVLHTGKGQAA